jgi:hypothetical protein
MIFFICLLGQSGCEQKRLLNGQQSKAANGSASVYVPYAPAKIDIMPLTEFVKLGDAGDNPEINVYVGLLDSFGSAVKSPGTFRFEMYEYVQLSSEPMGKRVTIWPDIDLTSAAENNKYWQDFLRAYQFNLPFEPAGGQSYILQVTFLCPTGRRLSDEFIIKRTN